MILSVFKVFYVKVIEVQLLVDNRSDSTKMHGATIRFTKCVFCFSLQLVSGHFIILKRTERDMITNVHWSSCKVPLF